MMMILLSNGIMFLLLNSFYGTTEQSREIPSKIIKSAMNDVKKHLLMNSSKHVFKSRHPDGHFNSIPVYHKRGPIYSSYQCVGENFREDSWQFRSCSFRNLCMDMRDRQFVLLQSPEQKDFQDIFAKQHRLHTHSSTTGNLTVSLGGINPKWRGAKGKLKWFPKVIQADSLKDGYYELPGNSLWVPWHSFAGYNVGHLFWDDFFPIFKLLTMFHLLSTDQPGVIALKNPLLILTKFELKLWGTCDYNPKRTEACNNTFPKFLPAMGVDANTFSSQNTTQLSTFGDQKSNFVCAPRGAAGLGMLTDHGLKLHGWTDEDYETTHNAGRGLIFYQFRNFILSNLGIPVKALGGPPYKLVFSRFSSDTEGRVTGFGSEEKLLRKRFSSDELVIEGYRMSRLSLHEQVKITSEASIFVTVVGGGAMTATFLPQGSTLIAFYPATGGILRNQKTNLPARLDWDVLNHASHIRLHWLPLETRNEPESLDFFSSLVRHELDIIKECC